MNAASIFRVSLLLILACGVTQCTDRQTSEVKTDPAVLADPLESVFAALEQSIYQGDGLSTRTAEWLAEGIERSSGMLFQGADDWAKWQAAVSEGREYLGQKGLNWRRFELTTEPLLGALEERLAEVPGGSDVARLRSDVSAIRTAIAQNR